MTRDEIQSRLQDIFSSHLGASSATTEELVPLAVSGGKLYEAYVLSRVVERLALSEGYTLSYARDCTVHCFYLSSPWGMSGVGFGLWLCDQPCLALDLGAYT